MPQEQPPYPSIASHNGCIVSGAVPILLGAVGAVQVVGAFMIEHVHALQPLMKGGNVARVGTIGIAAGRIGRLCEPAVWHHIAFGGHPVGTILDVVNLADGDFIGVDHVATDVRQRRFFAEQEPATRQTVFKRNAFHSKASILVDDLLPECVDGMEHHLEFQPEAEHLQLSLQHRLEGGGSIDVKGCRTAQQAEG